MNNIFFWAGFILWGSIIFILYLLRSKSRLHNMTLDQSGSFKSRLPLFLTISVIMICSLPMGLCPIYNGESPGHRNQYEVMAESILNGHLYMDYDVDPKLLDMENPYDYEARLEIGVNHPWDHAYYNGHFYMYFGIVPVFLLFLPWRIITGVSLTTYHATQIFAALFIIGVFRLFYFYIKTFFRDMTLAMYLLLSSAFSIMSIWYSINAPALYCTANVSGICVQIWSIYLFSKAVWGECTNINKRIAYAFGGSLLGALAFGCRPPVAFANLLVIPMLIEFMRGKKLTLRLAGKLIIAASPYIFIGLLLMSYNYLRFENPFEFGQSYQLTIADQRDFGSLLKQFDIFKVLNGLLQNFIYYEPLRREFPYISYNGAFVNFPILAYGVFLLFLENTRRALRNVHLYFFSIVLFILPLLITTITILGSPCLIERYRMDIYWLMGILSFLAIGFYHSGLSEVMKAKFSHSISVWAFITVFSCVMLYLVPYDFSLTEYDPAVLETIKKIFTFGMS